MTRPQRLARFNPESCANPLYYEWMHELYTDAASIGSKSVFSLKKPQAMDAIKSHPEKIRNPKDLIKLKGVGASTVGRLEKRARELVAADPFYKDHFEFDYEDGQEGKGKPEKKRKNAARKTREYVPEYRSGAYALLIALSTAPEEGLTKLQLIEQSEKHCNASFTIAEKNQFYTAWNSIKTLVDKELVYSYGFPVRYRLTEDGMDLAERLKKAASGGGSGVKSSRPELNSLNSESIRVMDFEDVKKKKRKVGKEVELNTLNQESIRMLDVEVDVGKVQTKRRKVDETVTQVVSSAVKKMQKVEECLSDSSLIVLSSDDDYYKKDDITKRFMDDSIEDKLSQKSNRLTSETFIIDSFKSSSQIKSTSISISDGINDFNVDSLQFEPHVLKAGSYKILFVLDNREKLSPQDSAYIQDSLAKKQTPVITLPLDVGDFLWVAIGHDQHGNELRVVLDFMGERKRLDDLLHSIDDGRYAEQKHRLYLSNIGHVFYIIENYSVNQSDDDANEKQFEKIQSSIISSQIVESFIVKRTKSLDDTIDYFSILTNKINKFYNGKDIYVYPHHLFGKFESLAEMNKRSTKIYPNIERFHYPYEAYMESLSKSKNLTIKEQFLKMLKRIRGISGDKAMDIVYKYPTLKSLMDAYESCLSEEEKKNLFTNFPNRARRFGPQLSTKLYHLFNDFEYTS
ncbi:Restriction endonuclease type II-like domain-containing protein [Rozella allomycis CSF55]|uniref:Crossover junction endonuclease MUS81 n=1 Tax=Rozella allomycis (strain CSF55) TaxID=988480 RepID=A0A075B302_ROZAC|nr:Restriction endonuclease type II-like domain-containing protein [Rozella allomycis CSF55]|eukprot:EPZ36724.1 Restriction endonuclease type II-like domain-containing protein [Rozella allomycis CSF55]